MYKNRLFKSNKVNKAQSGGYNYYQKNPYNYAQDFTQSLALLPSTIQDFMDEDVSKEEKKRQGINLGVQTLFNGLNAYSNYKYAQRGIQRQQELSSQNQKYLEVPYERYGYKSYRENPYTYEIGGTYEGGGSVSQLGYKDISPYKNNPYLDIDSNQITMKGVSQPLIGQADTGEVKIMYPGKNYHFNGASKVREYKFQEGGETYGQYSYDDYESPQSQPISQSAFDYNPEEEYKSVFDDLFDDIPFSMTEDTKIELEGKLEGVLPIQNVLNDLTQLGIKPSSVTDGKHVEHSSHYKGRSLDVGLNTSFGGDTNKMEQFKDYYEKILKPKYPNLILRDERSHPKGQKVWSGSHYHLELK